MFKYIVFILALMLSGLILCNAAEPGSISAESLVINSFDVDKVDGLSPVCTLSLAENKKMYFYNYAEGGICPAIATGKGCPNSAVMKLNGKITILKQILSGENSSVFKSEDVTIITKYTPVEGLTDDEGGDFKFVIFIKTKNGEKKINMSGCCGI